MNNYSDWEEIFTKYTIKTTSPEGKMTFETSSLLAGKIIRMLSPEKQDSILEMGSGWGNLSLQIAPLVKQLIAIEPSRKNAESASAKALDAQITNIQFLRGSFEKPNYKECVDKVVTSLVFHQVRHSKRQKAIRNIYNLLKPGGSFIFCDTFFCFHVEADPERFNRIYRYLLPKTIPGEIYEKYIEPHFQRDPDYIYTWEDMKKYTPKNNWFYSLDDLKSLLHAVGFRIEQESELAPFFGMVRSVKPNA